MARKSINLALKNRLSGLGEYYIPSHRTKLKLEYEPEGSLEEIYFSTIKNLRT